MQTAAAALSRVSCEQGGSNVCNLQLKQRRQTSQAVGQLGERVVVQTKRSVSRVNMTFKSHATNVPEKARSEYVIRYTGQATAAERHYVPAGLAHQRRRTHINHDDQHTCGEICPSSHAKELVRRLQEGGDRSHSACSPRPFSRRADKRG